MGNLSVREVEGYHGTRWDSKGWMPTNFGTRERGFESLRARHFSQVQILCVREYISIIWGATGWTKRPPDNG